MDSERLAREVRKMLDQYDDPAKSVVLLVQALVIAHTALEKTVDAHKQKARELLAHKEECGFEPSRGELWEFIREVGGE